MTLAFIAGIALLLYPTVSDLYNQIGASFAVKGYEDHSQEMTREEKDGLLREAEEYNRQIAANPQSFRAGAPEDGRYNAILNPGGDGMIGFLTIDKIGVQVPIFHGTAEDMLSRFVGHLEGSSLPVGGTSTHAVISGHRGLPTARLFTDLDRMEVGDTFVITVLDRKMTYEVDKISVIEPDRFEDVQIVPGEDHVTLLTCTPYAVNTQRLLVRGKRVPNGPEPVDALTGPSVNPIAVGALVAAVALLAALLIVAVRRKRGRRMKGRHSAS